MAPPPDHEPLDAEVARRSGELLSTNQRLAHMNRVASMTQLAASIAHELNQPLAAILSNAQAARRMLERGAPDVAEVLAAIGDIVEDDRRAGKIIQRMRAMIKKGEPRADAQDLNELAREVGHLVGHDALLRGATLKLALAPELPCVQGDGIQLQQVVLNLVVNALDAVSERPMGGRRVEVRTGRDAEGRVLLSVEDSGKGIARADLERIFDSFFTTKAHGLGVGLSISRSIVEAHGGRLWAENNPGEGATFHCALPAWEGVVPAARERESRTSSPDAGALLGTSKRIALLPRAGDAQSPTVTMTRGDRSSRVPRPALPPGRERGEGPRGLARHLRGPALARRPRAGLRPRAGDRAPRPQAREHPPRRGRVGEGRRFRHRQMDRPPGRGGGGRSLRGRGRDPAVHGARAMAGGHPRCPRRSLGLRHHSP